MVSCPVTSSSSETTDRRTWGELNMHKPQAGRVKLADSVGSVENRTKAVAPSLIRLRTSRFQHRGTWHMGEYYNRITITNQSCSSSLGVAPASASACS